MLLRISVVILVFCEAVLISHCQSPFSQSFGSIFRQLCPNNGFLSSQSSYPYLNSRPTNSYTQHNTYKEPPTYQTQNFAAAMNNQNGKPHYQTAQTPKYLPQKLPSTYKKPYYGQPHTQTSYNPSQNFAKPTQTYVKPTQSFTKPTQTFAKPTQTYVKPTQTVAQLTQTFAKPTQTLAKPTHTYTKPTQRYTIQTQTRPEQSLANPGQSSHHKAFVTPAPYTNPTPAYSSTPASSTKKEPIIFHSKPSSAYSEESCVTPDGGNGNCISLMSCPALSRLLTSDADPQTRSYVNSFHCGWQGRTPKVCCSSENRFGERPTSRPAQQPSTRGLLPGNNECGIHDGDRIVGGEVAGIDEHPWITLLSYAKPNGRYGLHCGGALISKRYVVTAAHCIKGAGLPKTWRLASVRLGEWNISTPYDCSDGICSEAVQDINVAEVIVHENYNPDGDHDDIALIRLSRDAQFSGYVQPICLPLDSNVRANTFENIDATAAGWGKTETASHSDTKLKVTLPVVSNSQCGSTYSIKNRKIRPQQLCAGGVRGKDSCRGDSGGPLMAQTNNGVNWMLIGVVSYGTSPCGTQGWPGVYTRISSYVDWIQNHMRA